MRYSTFFSRVRSLGQLALLTIVFTVGTSVAAGAQNFKIEVFDSIEVGTSPAQIVVDTLNDQLHVLTSGYDANYNRVIDPDEGDVAAGWYKLDRNGEILDSLSFGTYFNSYPVRTAFDFEGRRLFAPIGEVIRSYDLDRMEILNDTIVDLNGAGVTWEPNLSLIAVSVRATDFSSPGRIYYVNSETGSVVGSLVSGPNPGDGFSTTVDPESEHTRTFVLNEGSSGSVNASLTMVGLSQNVYRSQDGFGGGAEHGILHEDRVFFSLPQSSLVRVLDASTHTDVEGSPIDIPDDRTIHSIDVNGAWLAVLTEGGNLLVYDRQTLALLHELSVPGAARSVAIGDGRFHVTGPVNSKGVPLTFLSVVQTDGGTRTVEVGPGPSKLWWVEKNRVLVVGEDNGLGEGWWNLVDVEEESSINSGTIPAVNFNATKRAAFNREEMLLGLFAFTELLEIDVTVDSGGAFIAWDPEDAHADRLVAADGIWYLANYPGDFAPEPSWVYGVEVGTGVELGRIVVNADVPVLPVPGRSTVEGAGAFYAIPTPGFGGTHPPLSYVEHHSNIFDGELGEFANHINRGFSECFGEPMTMVTLSGSHEVVMLNGMEGNPTISERTSTGTSGFDGPRATVAAPCVPAIFCGAVLTTTYGGEVLLLWDGDVVGRADLPGRGEGLALFGDSAYAANILEKGTFDKPMQSISPIFIDWPTSVSAAELPADRLAISPNPVVDRLRIDIAVSTPGDVSVDLLDLDGRTILVKAPEWTERGSLVVEMSLPGLPSGAYLLKVRTPDGVGTRMLRVVR